MFSAFTRDNDPYGEHDFGSVLHGDAKHFWKIDDYDTNGVYGSENPFDAAVTALPGHVNSSVLMPRLR